MPSEAQKAPSDLTKKVFLLAALAIPVAPSAVYFFSASPASFWLGQIFTSLLLLVSPLLLGAKPRTTLLVVAPFAVLSPVLTIYALATGYAPSLLALQVLREASRNELANFIPAIAICAISSFAIGIAYWSLGKSWGRKCWLPNRWLRYAGLTALVLALGKDVLRQGPREGSIILLSRLEKMSPIAPVVLAVHLELSGLIIPDRESVLDHYIVTLDPTTPKNDLCVLVIGESARKNAFGLYNPQLGTTPLLAARDVITFTDATTCGSATIQAVPILMTGRFPSNDEILPFKALGLIEAFRLAGYQTHWLSSQDADGEISSFITAFSVNAQQRHFINGRLERSAHRNPELKDDSALLPLLSNIASQPGRHFVVLHTLGSHLPYARRYPQAFEKWPVDPAASHSMWRWIPPYNQAQRTALDHAYFNSVYFTDWVLDQVITILNASDRSSSMIYLSDHGENDASAPVMPSNHGIVTTDIINIPFFMWFSNDYLQLHPQRIEALAKNAHLRVSAQDLFATLCSLHGVQTSFADPDRDLSSRDYREHPRQILSLDGQTILLSR